MTAEPGSCEIEVVLVAGSFVDADVDEEGVEIGDGEVGVTFGDEEGASRDVGGHDEGYFFLWKEF